MDPGLVLALSGIVTAIIVAVGAIVTSQLSARQIRQAKEQDWARQDAVAAKADDVAAQAAKAAKLLLEAQRDTTARTEEVARLAALRDERTEAKLEAIDAQGKVIHSLVNNKLTTVIEQALGATLALLPFLEEAVSRMRAAGLEPPEADLQRLADTRRSIVDLRATLEQRAETQAAVDATVNGAHEPERKP